MTCTTDTWTSADGGKRDWIQTRHGHKLYVPDPDPESIDHRDIAWGLAHQPRFAGHTRHFYSVAQHSVAVARIVPDHLKLWALLHDASEAYLCDVPAPFKRLQIMAGYRELEKNLMFTIAAKFGLRWPVPREVKYADAVMCATEARDLLVDGPLDNWIDRLPDPLGEKIDSILTAREAVDLWMFHFSRLFITEGTPCSY